MPYYDNGLDIFYSFNVYWCNCAKLGFKRKWSLLKMCVNYQASQHLSLLQKETLIVLLAILRSAKLELRILPSRLRLFNTKVRGRVLYELRYSNFVLAPQRSAKEDVLRRMCRSSLSTRAVSCEDR